MTAPVRSERFAYITVLRGVAAVIVAGGHVIGMPPPDHPEVTFFAASVAERAVWPFLFGAQMVWLFLILSGFALYWSESSRRQRAGSGVPWRSFAKRRFWRIAPTYYAAIVFSLIVLFCGRGLMIAPSPSLNTSTPVTSAGFVSHLVFVHNASLGWVHQICPPLWSIAIEVQLYLLLPICFLGVWHRKPYIPVALLIIATHLLDRLTNTSLFGMMEWFGIGILLAWFLRTFRPRARLVYGSLATALLLAAVLAGPYLGSSALGKVLWGTGLSLMMIALHTSVRSGRDGLWWKASTKMGEASYSLYVIHFPIALAVWWIVGRLIQDQVLQRLWMVVVSFPLIAVGTYVMYAVIERPSTNKARVS